MIQLRFFGFFKIETYAAIYKIEKREKFFSWNNDIVTVEGSFYSRYLYIGPKNDEFTM